MRYIERETYWIFGSADMVGDWVIKRATVLLFVVVCLCISNSDC